jgi:flagellar hook-basal body complex protein FliE
MADFISSIGAGSAGRADLARKLAAMREAAQGGTASGVQGGGDNARTFSVDVGAGDKSSFGDTLARMLNEVSSTQDRASDAVSRFTRGEHVEMHEVMAATEEAGIALEMLVELRNKLTDAYRALINMQS